jgi:hypothetical protein
MTGAGKLIGVSSASALSTCCGAALIFMVLPDGPSLVLAARAPSRYDAFELRLPARPPQPLCRPSERLPLSNHIRPKYPRRWEARLLGRRRRTAWPSLSAPEAIALWLSGSAASACHGCRTNIQCGTVNGGRSVVHLRPEEVRAAGAGCGPRGAGRAQTPPGLTGAGRGSAVQGARRSWAPPASRSPLPRLPDVGQGG